MSPYCDRGPEQHRVEVGGTGGNSKGKAQVRLNINNMAYREIIRKMNYLKMFRDIFDFLHFNSL